MNRYDRFIGQSRPPCRSSYAQGFSLIEIGMVLIIIAFLLTMVAIPLSTQIDIRRVSETEKTIGLIKEAMVGYAVSRPSVPYLPCPDNNFDGLEDTRVAGSCPFKEGWVPWQSLGLAEGGPLTDGWGNLFRYRVEPGFSNSTTGFTFSPPTAATIRVCRTNACTATLATSIPFVVLSHGKNGFGARNAQGLLNQPPVSVDELANTDGRNPADTLDMLNVDFVSHEQSTGSPATEFDDIVSWMASNLLFSKMLAAGKLP